MTYILSRQILPGLALLCVCAASPAVEVYRSVDASGTPSFSDRPPADASSEQLTINASAPPPSEEDARRREEIRLSADRLHASRIQREADPGGAGMPPPPQYPVTAPRDADSRDDWPLLYYPPYSRTHHRPHWPSPPLTAPPIPRPNPDAASPRGLSEKIRRTWQPSGS